MKLRSSTQGAAKLVERIDTTMSVGKAKTCDILEIIIFRLDLFYFQVNQINPFCVCAILS